MEIIYYNRKKVVHNHKAGNLIGVDIVEDVEMAEVTFEVYVQHFLLAKI